MITTTLPVIDRRRPAVATAEPKAAPSYPVFGADEIGWLEVEASSRLGAAGRPITALRVHEPTPLGRLVRDPRLEALASDLAGSGRVLVAAELGRAAALRRRHLGDTTLFVELGGPVQGRPGTVHTDLEDVASTTLLLAVGFDCTRTPRTRDDRVASTADDLWPPAAVVAG